MRVLNSLSDFDDLLFLNKVEIYNESDCLIKSVKGIYNYKINKTYIHGFDVIPNEPTHQHIKYNNITGTVYSLPVFIKNCYYNNPDFLNHLYSDDIIFNKVEPHIDLLNELKNIRDNFITPTTHLKYLEYSETYVNKLLNYIPLNLSYPKSEKSHFDKFYKFAHKSIFLGMQALSIYETKTIDLNLIDPDNLKSSFEIIRFSKTSSYDNIETMKFLQSIIEDIKSRIKYNKKSFEYYDRDKVRDIVLDLSNSF